MNIDQTETGRTSIGGGATHLRARLLRRVAAASLGLICALLLTEAGLRLTGHGPAPLVKRRLHRPDAPGLWFHCYASNERGAFEGLPDIAGPGWRLEKMTVPPRELPLDRLSETPWCVRYELSEEGARGPSVSPEPPAGVVRIAGIGDSFAFGEGVAPEDSLFPLLQARLGDGVEIPNWGRSGADIGYAVGAASAATRDFGAARAIVVVTPNDIPIPSELRERVAALTHDLVTDEDDRPFWVRASALLQLAHNASNRRRASAGMIDTYVDAYDPDQNAAGLATLAGRMRRLAAIPDCRVAVVAYPLLVRLENYPLTSVGEAIVRAADEAGLPALDLTSAFLGRHAPDLHVHVTDQHPNGDAHRIAADAIATWLTEAHPDFLRPDED